MKWTTRQLTSTNPEVSRTMHRASIEVAGVWEGRQPSVTMTDAQGPNWRMIDAQIVDCNGREMLRLSCLESLECGRVTLETIAQALVPDDRHLRGDGAAANVRWAGPR